MKKKFKSYIGTLNSNVFNVHIYINSEIYDKMTKDGNKRVLCKVNDNEYFHSGLMPKGDGHYFIMLNKSRMKKFKLEIGDEVKIELEKDTSKYGMKMPPEFDEVLGSDVEGSKLFEELTDGKKRNLIHLVAITKSTDLRITKALIMMDHLKANNGKLDHKMLNEAMKPENRNY